MCNKNSHVKDYLEYYCQLDREPCHAVLLKGKWGTGKTWFMKHTFDSLGYSNYKDIVKKTSWIKNIFKPRKDLLKDKENLYLYVSLYGVTSVEDIENEFFKQLCPRILSKSMGFLGGMAKSAIKSRLGVDLDNIPSYLTNTDGYILVFDDLERATINLESLLGYINHYVEYQGYKVIIVANEDEILAKQEDNGDPKCSYSRIKEKLIGKTFEIEHDLLGVLSCFINEIECEKVKKLYSSNTEFISNTYDKLGYKNLRHLKQTLFDFERFVKLISEDAQTKDGLLLNLLKIFFIFSFEIKRGNILPEDIRDPTGNDTPENMPSIKHKKEELEEDEAKKIDKIIKEHKLEDIGMPIDRPMWRDFFYRGYYDKVTLQKSLENSTYYRTEDDWQKLLRLHILSEDKFTTALKSVENDFKDKKYTKLGEVKHVVAIFLLLSKNGLIKKEKKNILESSKLYINYLREKESFEIESPAELNEQKLTHSWGGYSFKVKPNESEEFKALIQYIEKVREEVITESHPEIESDLLKSMADNPSEFLKKIEKYSDLNNSYYKKNIFTDFDPEKFVNQFVSIESKYRYCITNIFQERYKYKKELSAELEWLKKVIKLLDKKVEVNKGKVTGYQLGICTNTLRKLTQQQS